MIVDVIVDVWRYLHGHRIRNRAAHIAETGHLTVPDISRATEAHETTVRAWLRGARAPSGDHAERLAELSAIVERLARVIEVAYIPGVMRTAS